MIIRNIREFTVAVSNYLKEKNWDFDAKFSRYSGMSFTLRAVLQGKKLHIRIFPSSPYPFKCSLELGDCSLYSFEIEGGKDIDLEPMLSGMTSLLEEIRDERRKI